MELWRNGTKVGENDSEILTQLLYDAYSTGDETQESEMVEAIRDVGELIGLAGHKTDGFQSVVKDYLCSAMISLVGAYNEMGWCDVCHNYAPDGLLSNNGGVDYYCKRHPDMIEKRKDARYYIQEIEQARAMGDHDHEDEMLLKLYEIVKDNIDRGAWSE
jgi:hypothetical protein